LRSAFNQGGKLIAFQPSSLQASQLLPFSYACPVEFTRLFNRGAGRTAPQPQFCKANHILKLSLFGSVLRDDFQEDSDLDILVEFEPGKAPGLIGLSRMERQLSEMLRGQKVDLRTPHDLSKYFRDEVLANAEVQYAAA
jgi:predicted nucleotidyltransferase